MKKRWMSGMVMGVLALALGACEGVTEPSADQQMSGVIMYASASGGGGLIGQDGLAIGSFHALEAPDTVQAGETFQVRVTTVGDGCWARGTMEVSTGADFAELRPYDVYSGQEVCIMIAQFFRYEASLRFDTRGEATLRVFGRKVSDGNLLGGEETVIEKTITVL